MLGFINISRKHFKLRRRPYLLTSSVLNDASATLQPSEDASVLGNKCCNDIQGDHSDCSQPPIDKSSLLVWGPCTKMQPLFWCQREVGNNVNDHPALQFGTKILCGGICEFCTFMIRFPWRHHFSQKYEFLAKHRAEMSRDPANPEPVSCLSLWYR